MLRVKLYSDSGDEVAVAHISETSLQRYFYRVEDVWGVERLGRFKLIRPPHSVWEFVGKVLDDYREYKKDFIPSEREIQILEVMRAEVNA